MFGSSKEILIIIGISAFLFVITLFVINFLIYYQKVRKRYYQEKELLQANYQQELLRTQLEIQEQTLKTISQEIHDNIGQTLSLAKLNLALADEEAKPPLQQKITDSHQLVSKAIQDLRDLSRSLNTDYVAEMGLHRSIGYELEMIRKTGVMQTEMAVEGQPRLIDKQKELILFRIVQESLNNIIKHAQAANIAIVLKYLPGALYLSIKDNGQGVDLSPLNDSTTGFGLGIRNMHNRAKLIGADFNVNSSVGQGTEVTIHLPNE
jgi:signal transduction histidine kinase